ncbi:MAG: glycosyltransferase family 2 protein [Vicinamibacterales bacterium]
MPDTMPDGRPWPRLSIVSPSFNQGAFIEAAIRSILLQGYPRLELIVIDGGSTDGSVEIIRKYEPWLTVWRSEPDEGPAHALNKGFALATGEIVGFLNTDDFYLPWSLTRMAREFRRYPTADVISGHGYHAGPSGELGAAIFSDRWDAWRFAYGACVLIQQATFFRRRAFAETDGFNQQLRTSWDMELWADMARNGARFHACNEFLAVFRLHADSITGSLELSRQCRKDVETILRRVRGRPETAIDDALTLVQRFWKFLAHPGRTVSQRLFLHETLGRWSL